MNQSKTLKNDWNLLTQNLDRLVSFSLDAVSHPHTIRLFRIVIYSWVFLYTLHLLPAAEHFWGSGSYIARTPLEGSSWYQVLMNVLNISGLEDLYPVFILGQLLCCLLAIFNFVPRLSSVLVFWFTINLDSRAYVLMDGGNNLIHIMLFLLILMHSKPFFKQISLRYFEQGLINAAFLVARVQLCLVYLCAGLAKVTGTLWPSGMALFYTLGVSEYTHPFAQAIFTSHPLLFVPAAYVTVLFQISFAFLIWNRKIRPLMLLIGLGLHLSIAGVMGLVFFGLAMIAIYFIFYTDEKSKKVLAWFRRPEPLLVGFDENCKICMKSAQLVKVLDWSNLIKIDRANQPQEILLQEVPLQDRLKSMVSLNPKTKKVYSGFDSLYEIIKRLPLGKLVLPIFAGLQYLGLGERLYQRWALKSSWRRKCQEGICYMGDS